jgi:hypothetical protein
MRRFSLGVLFHGTLFATAVCLSYPAAASASAGDPVPVRASEGTGPDAQAEQDPAQVSADGWEGRAGEDDRAYLLETASPGATMTRQGPEIAIARLNPEFVVRLASAIRDARVSGLPSAGIFSAYRPPGFGIGGFADKFKSLHAYGLAVDMTGIGEPGSKDAKLWHEIAERHGIFCPYGFDSRTEWNHCQATPLKSVIADNPLRRTITADGPVALEEMFEVGNAVIDDPAAAEEADTSRPTVVRVALASASERLDRGLSHVARSGPRQVLARAASKAKSKMLVSAIDARSLAKSRRKPGADPKPHDARRAARTAEGHREPPHRRSHVA